MSEHTPGPWVILPRELHDGQWIIPIETADGWQIAEVEEGNERLISAAPDMRDASVKLLEAYDNRELLEPKLFEDLRRALAKAKGEE